ncbi:hypothetical protein [Campylobacter showae]|uniref:Uncharacterized protein n=1 Tax=Campylobacter showae CC57C TaxID=1073353 RepID=M3JBF3_9BACT|nr:hypothetical protein [Campylobacter showae]EMG30002.1 hypothetical protein H740_08686 [Campylobacter showae CC57C]
MDILKLLLGNSGGMLDAMSQKSGLGTNDIEAVISKVAPIFMQRQFLDQNKNGSIVDDIFRIAGDFFGKK